MLDDLFRRADLAPGGGAPLGLRQPAARHRPLPPRTRPTTTTAADKAPGASFFESVRVRARPFLRGLAPDTPGSSDVSDEVSDRCTSAAMDAAFLAGLADLL